MASRILLENLETVKYFKLTKILNDNDNWIKVAKGSRFSSDEIANLSRSHSPADSLLDTLITRKWELPTLELILQKCNLYLALDIISKPEPMKVVSQPTDKINGNNKLTIARGARFELTFDVTGVPWPKFQWFKRYDNENNEVLENQNSSTLQYNNFDQYMNGKYFCVAMQQQDEIISEIVEVEMQMEPCRIIKKPEESVYFCEGSAALLEVQAVAYPEPSYQWFWENQLLPRKTEHILAINQVSRKNCGKYQCQIKNKISEIYMQTNLFIYSETKQDVYKGPISDKVALLISNEEYSNMPDLLNPSNDVSTIAIILQKLNFRTLCFQNLNLDEIKSAVKFFSQVVDTTTLAFFYYAGHGYEMGDKFLLPVDCPEWDNLKMNDSIAESFILNQILIKQPILFISILDMCLKMPDRMDNSSIYRETFAPYTFESNRNLIRAYSTTSHLPAYEKRGCLNGIYVDALRNHLHEDIPILTIFSEVNTDISKICSKQMPSVSYNTAQDFYLSHKILDKEKVPHKEYFEKISIESEMIEVNDTTVRLLMYKQVFNNCIQINVSNNLFDYGLLPKFEPIKVVENDQLILQFRNLQRIDEKKFLIQFRIGNAITVTICKELSLSFIFKKNLLSS